MPIPEIAIGAIIAALIAGTISLLGLVISKEQKTSEFRQAWIDSLRNDLTSYLTQVNAINDAVKIEYKTAHDKIEALQPRYMLLNSATFNIVLRVNPNEKKSKRLLDAMKDFNDLTENDINLTSLNVRSVETEFLNASQELLKSEWKRVKSGEWTFRIAKILATLVIMSSIAVCGTISYKIWISSLTVSAQP